MTRFKTTLFVAAAALGATGALAQTTQTTAPQTTAPQTTAPATSDPAPAANATTPVAPAAYTDADVDAFAGAALAVQKIQQDAAVPDADKQTKMASAVTASGLTAEKFNAMATASQADPALMKRIQMAAAKKQTSGGAGATGAADTSGSTGQ